MMILINQRNFRGKIWYEQADDRESSLTMRKNNFVSLLKQFRKSPDGYILYEINGKSVCKSFFKVLTSIYKCNFKNQTDILRAFLVRLLQVFHRKRSIQQ